MSASDRSFISAGVFAELLALFLAYMLGTRLVNRFGKRAVLFVFRRLFHLGSVNRYLYLLFIELGFCVIVLLLRFAQKFLRRYLYKKLSGRRPMAEAVAFIPGTSMAASLLTGMYMLVFVAISLAVNTYDALANGYALQGKGTILFSTVYFLLVGLAEEGMFRGILAGGLLEEAGAMPEAGAVSEAVYVQGAGVVPEAGSVSEVAAVPDAGPVCVTAHKQLTSHTIWCGVVFSSLLFSLAHGRGILSGPDLGTVIQMLGAFGMGLYLAAVYYRTRNIWAVALLHGLNDIAAGVFVTIFRVEDSLGGVVSGYSWGNLLVVVPFVIAAVFLLRPAGMEMVREKWTTQGPTA